MQKRITGALLDPFDPRDFPLGELTSAIDIAQQPDSKITDISMIPVLNQEGQPACVGYARATILTYLQYKETGKVEQISPDFGYALAKMFDGLPDMFGTFPRILAEKNIDVGALLAKDFKRDLSLPHNEYKALDLTQKIKIKAAPQRLKAYGNLARMEAALVQAILYYDLLEVSLPCDGYWSGTPVKNRSTNTGLHRIVVFGYERREDDTYFHFRNSWGTAWGNGGNNTFAWKDFANLIFDMYGFTDIPNEQLAEIKKIPVDLSYKWNTDLKRGSKSKDVQMLQFALKLEGCMDLLVPTDITFGPKTELAVIAFQKKYKLPTVGICGPQTRAILNQHYAPVSVISSLDRWAYAIQSHEGYYAPGRPGYPLGSIAWRCNNPGNIRCFGKYKQMAKGCHAQNYCIFESYEAGFDALKMLLRDAASGKSTVYSPEMPLYSHTFNPALPRSTKNMPGFFQVYAPTGDGNSPSTYALAVAKAIGVPVDTRIKNLI